jgi:hypothetical protein
LGAAAEQGTEIQLGVDAYAFMTDSTTRSMGPLWAPIPFRQAAFKRRMDVLADLALHESVNSNVLNKPEHMLSNPFAGRSHIKLAVVNNTVYLGGPNFHDSDRLDVALRWDDSRTADYLYSLATELVDAGTTKVLGNEDFTHRIDEDSELLIDVGKPRQSLTLEHALTQIDDAKEWVMYVGQFFPGGITGRHLAQAVAENVDVRTLYNHPANHVSMAGLWQHMALAREQRRLPAELFQGIAKDTRSVHAALVATDQGFIKGGHNFIDTGVKLGTAELSLHCQSPTLSKEMGQFVLDQLGVETAD